MLADDVLQPMYELAYFLHPDPAVALTVTLDAADRLALLRRLREHPIGHAWRRFPTPGCPNTVCTWFWTGRDAPTSVRDLTGPQGNGRPGMTTWCAISSVWAGGPYTARPVMC